MSVSPVLGNPKPQIDVGGVPANLYRMFIYLAGTSTKATTYTDSTAATENSNPVVFNSEGYPVDDNGAAVAIYATTGIALDIVFAPPGSDDPPTTTTWSLDSIYPGWSGADLGWGPSYTVTYTDADTLTVAGSDVSDIFHVGRRVWCSDASTPANDVYGVVKSVSFSTDTTIDIEVDDGASINANTDTLYPAIPRADTKSSRLNYYPTLASETVGNIENWDYEWGNLLRYIPRTYHATIRDGTITTNLKTYIDNWLADLGDDINGIIPEGTYPYTGTITITGDFDFLGAGRGKAIFDITPSAGTPHMLIYPTTGNSKTNGKIGGFTIKGQASASVSGEYGLQIGSLTNSSAAFISTIFEDVYVTGVADHAFYLERQVYGCSFYDFHAEACYGDGINIADPTSGKCNANKFYSPTIRQCKQGIVVQNSLNNTFYSPWIEALAGETISTGKAVDIHSTSGSVKNCYIYDPYIEWNESTDPLLVNFTNATNCGVKGGQYSINKSGTTNPLVATSFIEIDNTNDNIHVEDVQLAVDSGTVATGVNNDENNSVIINVRDASVGTITTLIDDSTTTSIVINKGVVGATGTWTPDLQFGGATTGITYDQQSGKYHRIGKTVFIEGYIDLSSKGSASGTATIAGLPFTAAGAPNGCVVFGIGQAAAVSGYVQPSGAYLNIFLYTGVGSADTDFTNGTILRFSGHYLIA